MILLNHMIIPVIVFSVFILSISYKMLPFYGLISYVDSVYFFPDGFFNFFSTWRESFLGAYNSNLFGIPITGNLPKILNFFGLTDNVASYILNYAPVFILCLLVFFIIKKISNNNFYAYFAGFFIILNNFIFQQFLIWPGHYFYNVIGLVLLFYQTYKIFKQSDSLKFKDIAILILISVFAIHPIFFAIYMAYLFCFFAFYFFRVKKDKVKYVFSVSSAFIGTFFIHLYWIIPFVLNNFYQSVAESYNGNLTAILDGYSKMVTYSNSINYYNYPGLFSSLLNNDLWQYLFYFIFFGLIIGVTCKISQINRERNFLLFMLLVYVIFFALAMGPKEKLLGDAWMYFFNNVPFFGFFRSFTRFLIVSLISTIFIFALFIREWVAQPKRKNFIVGIAGIFLLSANLIFFTGNLDGGIGPAKIPEEYYKVNEQYFKNDPANFSFISYPNVPYEAYTWSINKNINLFISDIYFNLYFFSKPAVYNDLSVQIQRRDNFFKDLFKFEFKPYENLDRDLSRLNAKYVFVHRDLVDILNKGILNRGEAYKYDNYLKHFENNPKYILKEENRYFYLFEFRDFPPILSVEHPGGSRRNEGLSFYRIFDTKYKLILKNLKTKTDLSFLSSFHEAWYLYLTKNVNNNGFSPKRTIFEGEELSYLWKKPIFNNSHKIVYDYANGWEIDPNYIKINFDKSFYKENPDGSIDVELILYFKPQSYFYLGLVISVTTLLGCIGYLILNFIKKRKRRPLGLNIIEEDKEVGSLL